MRLAILIGFIVQSLAAGSAFGWGGDGHRIVARLAELRLSPESKVAVSDLLGNASLPDVAIWADQIRSSRRETGPWHYVDIPFDQTVFNAARDGRNGENVIDRIDVFAKTLADPSIDKPTRIEALKFLVHLVGDLHQPLHCAERNGDRGGNGRLVFFLDEPTAINLHAMWDTSILTHVMNGAPMAVYAGALNARIAPENEKAWITGTTADWAAESHRIAVERVYAGVPVDGPPPKLGKDYVDPAATVVDGQLEHAGVRLAYLLNKALGARATTGPISPRLNISLPTVPATSPFAPASQESVPTETAAPAWHPSDVKGFVSLGTITAVVLTAVLGFIAILVIILLRKSRQNG